MAGAKQFIFVELLDEPVVALLSSLRSILSDEKSESRIHITLRGPYKTKAIWDFMREVGSEKQHDPILISGQGQFRSGPRFFVYLRARADSLERLMFKPDFPKGRFGSNPHITVYEGTNAAKAAAVLTFLKSEQIYFLCKTYRFVPYTTKQISLPFEIEEVSSEDSFDELTALGKVRPGVLIRARRLREQFS